MTHPPPTDPLRQAEDSFIAAQVRELWAREHGPAVGLPCPNPGCEFGRGVIVLYVRDKRGGRFRRRECLDCGCRFSTFERLVGKNLPK